VFTQNRRCVKVAIKNVKNAVFNNEALKIIEIMIMMNNVPKISFLAKPKILSL
jgi:hypothetical protein